MTAECVYAKSWLAPGDPNAPTAAPSTTSHDAKLIFGTVFSLRNMARRLGGDDDAFISYRTATYRLHFYETPASLRFVMLTDTGSMSMRNVLHQIYINLWVEYGTFSARLLLFLLGERGGKKEERERQREREMIGWKGAAGLACV